MVNFERRAKTLHLSRKYLDRFAGFDQLFELRYRNKKYVLKIVLSFTKLALISIRKVTEEGCNTFLIAFISQNLNTAICRCW